MAPPLIFLFFVVIVAAVIVIGALVAIRTGLWIRETAEPSSSRATDGPDTGQADRTARGSRDDTRAAEAAASEGRERVYGDQAATDDR